MWPKDIQWARKEALQSRAPPKWTEWGLWGRMMGGWSVQQLRATERKDSTSGGSSGRLAPKLGRVTAVLLPGQTAAAKIPTLPPSAVVDHWEEEDVAFVPKEENRSSKRYYTVAEGKTITRMVMVIHTAGDMYLTRSASGSKVS